MVSVVFVWRSFYGMRIGAAIEDAAAGSNLLPGHGDEMSLNPQPEPPGVTIPSGDAITLNPQPEPLVIDPREE